MGPPRWGAFQRLVLRQLLVIGPIPANSFGLQQLNPGSDNGSQGFHGEFVQAASEELHELIDLADVERARFFAGIFIVLIIVTKVLGDMLLLGTPADYGWAPLPLLWLLGGACAD
jgi:hypothetical protein